MEAEASRSGSAHRLASAAEVELGKQGRNSTTSVPLSNPGGGGYGEIVATWDQHAPARTLALDYAANWMSSRGNTEAELEKVHATHGTMAGVEPITPSPVR